MKKLLYFCFTAILFTVYSISLFAAEKLMDNANLLTGTNQHAINTLLNQISERQKCDVIIVTVTSLEDKDAYDYAEDYFYNNYYGYGDKKDGILFLISISERDWSVFSNEFGSTAVTPAGRDYIMEEVKPFLSDENFNKAFTEFATQSDKFLTQARSGNPYGEGHLPRKNLANPFINILISLGIGVIIALCITAKMKGDLKTVNVQTKADSYVQKDSLNITASRESFLYKNVSCIARQTASSGSSNGGSSGGSKGASSGKF